MEREGLKEIIKERKLEEKEDCKEKRGEGERKRGCE